MFPHNITIDECRTATRGFPGFREQRKHDYISFNYDFAFRQTFPDPNLAATAEEARILSVRRECRGIIFHAETQQMLARRLHKFFNINEMDETTEDKIDLSKPHYILEKADGCLVSPFMSEGEIRFGSKGGLTDVSKFIEQTFLRKHPEMDYMGLSKKWIDQGCTPMFELCAQKHQVILEYEEDRMVLIAIRNNHTGDYMTLATLIEESKTYKVPMVEPIDWKFGKDYTDAKSLLVLIKAMDNLEGQDGTIYKAKSDWYISRSKKSGECAFFEKDIWQLVLDGKIDDFADALGPRRLETIGQFGLDLFEAIRNAAARINTEIEEAHAKGLSKKEFVDYIRNKAKETQDLLYLHHGALFFSVFDSGEPAYKTVLDFVRKNVSAAPKIDAIRNSICAGLSISLNETKP